MLRKVLGALAAIFVVGSLVVVSSPALADNCWTDAGGIVHCDVEVGGPGNPGTGPQPGDGVPADFTPGPTSCSVTVEGKPVVIPCSENGGWWNGSCYVSLADPQLPPGSHDPQVGAWYNCEPSGVACAAPNPNPLFECYRTTFWSDVPPPGINRYTPAQAAGLVVRLLRLSPIEIGMAPSQKVHADDPAGTAPYRRTWVGIPVWLWVGNPNDSTWGPQSVTATYGGVTVTATATAGQVVWKSGDGQSVSCGTGTQFDLASMKNKPAVDSPSGCGWRYTTTGNYTVTATTNWTVQWVGGGETGQIAMPTTQSSTTLQVGQLESVNVPVTEAMRNYG